MIHTIRDLPKGLKPEVESCDCAVCRSDVAYLSVCLYKREPEPLREIIRVRA